MKGCSTFPKAKHYLNFTIRVFCHIENSHLSAEKQSTGQNRCMSFANGLGDLGSVPGHIIPNTLKMVLDTSLLNTQQYKVCIKGKEKQSKK